MDNFQVLQCHYATCKEVILRVGHLGGIGPLLDQKLTTSSADTISLEQNQCKGSLPLSVVI
jgi:hypothetical protein